MLCALMLTGCGGRPVGTFYGGGTATVDVADYQFQVDGLNQEALQQLLDEDVLIDGAYDGDIAEEGTVVWASPRREPEAIRIDAVGRAGTADLGCSGTTHFFFRMWWQDGAPRDILLSLSSGYGRIDIQTDEAIVDVSHDTPWQGEVQLDGTDWEASANTPEDCVLPTGPVVFAWNLDPGVFVEYTLPRQVDIVGPIDVGMD